MIANKIKEAVKTSVEENKTDKEQLAKDCRELKTELEKAMKEQQEKATQ
jgi:gas vesicle protein